MSTFDYNCSNSDNYHSNFPSGLPSNPQGKPGKATEGLRPLPAPPSTPPFISPESPELKSRVEDVGRESLVKSPPAPPPKKIQAKKETDLKSKEVDSKNNPTDVATSKVKRPLPPLPAKKNQTEKETDLKRREVDSKNNKIDVDALQEVDALLGGLKPNFDDWDDLTNILDDFNKEAAPLVEESKKQIAAKEHPQLESEMATATPQEDKQLESEMATSATQEDKESAVGETKSKIGFVALSLLRTVSQKGEKKYDEYVKSQLDYRGLVSSEQTKLLQEKPAYQPDLQKASSYLPVNISISADQLQRPFTKHKAAAEQALQKKNLYEKVADKAIEKVGVLKAYAFNEAHEMQSGKIVPSSNWIGGGSVEEQNHLMNLYVIRPNGEPALVRSSKIDSKEKADEFITVLKTIRDEIRKETGNDNYQLRVISEQFNSFERESSMIKDQHAWLSYANEKMRDENIGELMHVSLPANTFYFISEELKRFGIVGNFLRNSLVNGEINSQKMNLDSWGTYLRWIGEDLSAHSSDADLKSLKTPEGKAVSDLIDGYLEKTQKLSKDIARNQTYCQESLKKIQKFKDARKNLKQVLKHGNLSEIKQAQKELRSAYKKRNSGIQELEAARKELRIHLEENHQYLAQLNTELNAVSKTLDRNQNPGLHDKLLAVRKPISLMKDILGSQLGIQKASRGRQLLMLQELNDSAGVSSSGNCKGGLDRTPIWHSVAITLKQMREVDNTDTFQMTEHWDTVTQDINIRIKQMGPIAFAQWVADDSPVEGKNGEVIDKKVYREVVEFRKKMMDNLMTISLPITERSTGLQGFKWSPGGYKENKMPLNFLPSHVELNGKQVAMVRYGKKGQALGLTVEGRQILTKFEGLRGS